MNYLQNLKPGAFAAISVVGVFISELLGGWDSALQTLIIFMVLDYTTGLLVAGLFKKSTKSTTGGIESYAGWKGLVRKGMTLAIVLVAAQLDIVMGTEVVRTAAIFGFLANEGISIIENARLMGVVIPGPIMDAINSLKTKK